MARQKTAVRINQFAGGFNTEANPLNFPPGASFDEENMDLLSNGSRKRRNGFNTDFGSPVGTPVVYPSGNRLGKNQYVWTNAGGIPDARFLVVQIGNYIGIHSLNSTNISGNRVFAYAIPEVSTNQVFGITSIDGVLVITTGAGEIYSISYINGFFTVSSGRLLIRDFFGVQASSLTDPENVPVRPPDAGDYHYYNLRNQTWARLIPNGDDQTDWGTRDPLLRFLRASGTYPSNADNVNFFKIANPEFVSNRTVERFNPISMKDTTPPNNRAPMGYFIIDALNRGASRQAALARLTNEDMSSVGYSWRPTVNLLADRTPGGPTTVAQYAGRVWFAGFRGDVFNGDKKSPRMSSYVLFSQVVKEPSQIYWCYQKADPTSNEDPDLVATDGGFIKIDGAYNIRHLVAADNSLFIFAENGVWRISGEGEDTFSATTYSVSKISDKGTTSPFSVIYVDGMLMYWSDSSILAIVKGDVGVWDVENMTDSTIKTFYQQLTPYEKENCFGYFDGINDNIRWLFGEDPENRTEFGELIFNRKFRVFSKNRVNLPPGTPGPISASDGKLSNGTEAPVTVEGEAVTSSGELVTTPALYNLFSSSQNFYCILTRLYPTIRYVFGGYNNEESPLDWGAITPIDTPAFLTTGFVTGGDGRLRKDIPYVTAYFNILNTASSCFLQTKWDWTNSPFSGEWTAPRQIYRQVDVRTGDSTVITRNKIRGIGRSAALNFTSEEGKFFHIFGWEHNLEATTDE